MRTLLAILLLVPAIAFAESEYGLDTSAERFNTIMRDSNDDAADAIREGNYIHQQELDERQMREAEKKNDTFDACYHNPTCGYKEWEH